MSVSVESREEETLTELILIWRDCQNRVSFRRSVTSMKMDINRWRQLGFERSPTSIERIVKKKKKLIIKESNNQTSSSLRGDNP